MSKYNPTLTLYLNDKPGKYFNPIPKGETQLQKIAGDIRDNEKLKARTIAYREKLVEKNYDKKNPEVRQLKHGFPMISVTGQFNYRDNVSYIDGTWTGLCAFDIDVQDNPDVDFASLSLLIQQDQHVLFLTESVSNGLKGFIVLDYEYSDPDSYRDFIIEYVYPVFENRWGVKLDPGQATFSQGIFVGHDPYVMVKTDESQIIPFKSKMESRPIPDYKPGIKFNSDYQALERFCSILSEAEEGMVYETVKKQIPIVARMFKGGSLDLTEEQCKDILHKSVCKAPGVTNPDLAYTQIAAAWKNAIRKYEPITQEHLARKDFLNSMAFWCKTGWHDKETPYALVGSHLLYETAKIINGDYYTLREKSSQQAISLRVNNKDWVQSIVQSMPKCDLFINEPDFLNYQKIIEGGYNIAWPSPIEPVKGNWSTINGALKFSFTDCIDHETLNGYDFILDWICILVRHPKEKLPGMIWKSRIHGRAGKTKLFQLLLKMLGYNAAKVRMTDLTNNFNASYADKVLTVIDETEYGDKKENESLNSTFKNMIDGETTTIEYKGMDPKEVPNRNHLILVSNKDKPIPIEAEDERWMVIDMPVHNKENIDPLIGKKFEEELPAFMHYLLHEHEIKFTRTSRLWFDEAILDTPAKRRIQEVSKSQIYTSFVDALVDYFLENPKTTRIRFIMDTLKNFLNEHDIKWYGNTRALNEMMTNDLELKKKQVRIEGGRTGKGWEIDKEHPAITAGLEEIVSKETPSVSENGNGQNLLEWLQN